tara:strand:+ start:4727 stop:5389 length:663 start_codon:yes stop_codon:yes gene_type:complete
MKIGIANSYDYSYCELGNHTWTDNKRVYAQRHGYEPLCKIYANDDVPHGFKKLFYILEIFTAHSDIDWVWFTGCDSMITNMTIKLEDIIKEHADENAHLIISKDYRDINADSFLIKNSEAGVNYINFICDQLDKYKNDNWAEQQAMIDHATQYSPIMRYVPQRTFNSYNYNLYPDCPPPHVDKLGHDGNWKHGDFLIHWPGINLESRIALYHEYKKFMVE